MVRPGETLTVAKHRRVKVIIPRVCGMFTYRFTRNVFRLRLHVFYIYTHAHTHIHQYICAAGVKGETEKERQDETFVVLSSSSGKWDIPLVGTEWENRDNRLGYYFSNVARAVQRYIDRFG